MAADSPVVVVHPERTVPPETREEEAPVEPSTELSNPEDPTLDEKVSPEPGKVSGTALSLGSEGVTVIEKAVGKPEALSLSEKKLGPTDTLAPSDFCHLLALRVVELNEGDRGPQGRTDMGHR